MAAAARPKRAPFCRFQRDGSRRKGGTVSHAATGDACSSRGNDFAGTRRDRRTSRGHLPARNGPDRVLRGSGLGAEDAHDQARWDRPAPTDARELRTRYPPTGRRRSRIGTAEEESAHGMGPDIAWFRDPQATCSRCSPNRERTFRGSDRIPGMLRKSAIDDDVGPLPSRAAQRMRGARCARASFSVVPPQVEGAVSPGAVVGPVRVGPVLCSRTSSP